MEGGAITSLPGRIVDRRLYNRYHPRSVIRPGGDVRYHRRFHLDPVVIDSHHQLVQTGSDKAFAMTGFVVVRMCADGIQGVCFWKVLREGLAQFCWQCSSLRASHPACRIILHSIKYIIL